jgi:hypothetical protein
MERGSKAGGAICIRLSIFWRKSPCEVAFFCDCCMPSDQVKYGASNAPGGGSCFAAGCQLLRFL